MNETPPRNGEGDRPAQPGGGGGPAPGRTDDSGPLRQACGLPPPRAGEGNKRHHTLSAPIKTVKLARRLRKNMSPTERRLWAVLRTRPGGFKFRKQHPLGAFALDFCCLQARIAIEVDGSAHDLGDRPVKDEARDALVARAGFATLRFPAREVHANLAEVVSAIVETCRAKVTH